MSAQGPRLACNLLVFLGRQDTYLAPRCVVADRITCITIAGGVKADTDHAQMATYESAGLSIVFSDAAREYDRIDAAQRCAHGRELFCRRIAKHIDGEARIGI